MKKNYISALLAILVFSFSGYSQNFRNIIKTYLDNNIQELNLVEEDVNEWVITSEVYSEKSEVTHIYIQQVYRGVPIYGAVGNFSIKDNEIKYAKNSFISNVSTKTNSNNPTITSKRAIEKVAVGLNLGTASAISLIESVEVNKFLYSTSGISQEKIPVNLVYQPIEDGTLKLSWDLSVLQLDGKHWWSVRVDASTGNIIHKNDWTVNCAFPEKDFEQSKNPSELDYSKSVTIREQSLSVAGEQYNVFAIPVESPNHGSRSVLTDPQNTVASPYGWHDTDEADGAEYTITRGNNVYVQQDSDGSNGTFGYSPDGGPALNFNFSLNMNHQYTDTYRDASLTNLFYINNIMHDVWYQYGFDSRAGNFQENIYALGGTGGDYVIADGQDVSGRNNANFSTPPDGSSPRMQMYIFDHPNLLFINSGIFQGDYTANDSNFNDGAASPSQTGVALSTLSAAITADIVIANDGSAAPIEACNALVNGAEMNGKIAIIRRGNCDFVVKIQNAQNAGAIGVIIVNNVASPEVIMGGVTTTVNIPAISIPQALGESLITAIQNGDTINASLADYGIDGSFDNGVIAHEYGHGISNRLIGGRNNVNCMQNSEQMGEGWSDFFGLMITIEAGDTGSDPRGIGTFDLGQSTTGNGFRQFPYSTDTAINPFTFASSNTQIAPHGVGSVWATMLWDLNWRMIDVYGFDPDFYNGTGGNNMTMHLIIEGLKLTPCSSGFVAARDAIIAADDALYNGDNKCLIWQVFSQRGLGFSASSGNTTSSTDQTEAFDMPPVDQLGGASCSLGVDDEKSDLFMIYPNPSNGEININGVGINEEVTITIFDVNGREVFAKKTILNGSTNINATNLNTGFYILKIKGDEFIYNEKILIE